MVSENFVKNEMNIGKDGKLGKTQNYSLAADDVWDRLLSDIILSAIMDGGF